ncbi:MAG: cell division protein SepF [Clostridia bacterium]|nr:cell division protein SepF [Clostridia bacterium]
MADFFTKFKDFITGGEEVSYEEETYEGIEDTAEETWGTTIEEPTSYGSYNTYVETPIAAAPVTPVVTKPVEQPSATVVMFNPYDIKTSQTVCDHIREGHIVICNLTASSNNQRVVDYISGGVYALDGRIEPTAVKTTFVCTPKNVTLYVEGEASETATKVSAL